MAQHDYDIANQSGANFRADLNNALDAIVSNNSGSSEPSTKFAYEWWIDTSNNLLKLRNSANNAWITLPLSITADNATSGALTVNGNLSTTGTLDVNGGEIILDADADTSITADTDDQIDFKVAGSDVASINSSGVLDVDGGITVDNITIDGTEIDLSSGSLTVDAAQNIILDHDSGHSLVLQGSGTSYASFFINNTTNLAITTAISGASIEFFANGSERMRIDSAGRLMIGTTTEGQADADDLTVANGSGNVGISLRTTTTGFASIYFSDATSGGAEASGAVQYKHDDNYMRFTTAESERIRITSAGNVGIGTTSPSQKLDVAGSVNFESSYGANATVLRINNSSASNSYFANAFYSGGTLAGYIFVNASTNTTQFATSSDYRLKENVNYDFDALSRVAQLKPARFNFIVDAETTVDGFLAHEVSDIVPEAIIGEKDGEQMQGIDQAKLVPLLTKAIQELEERVKTLEG